MAELYEDWLSGPMTRADYNELSDEEIKERKRLQNRNNGRKDYKRNRDERKARQKKYYEEHKEERIESNKQYYINNKTRIDERTRQYYQEKREERLEYDRKYQQTPAGKKLKTINKWVNQLGLQESDEDLDRIYELRETQELCNACDVVLTRNGDRCSTDATMDHDHDTHRFRHIICRGCNSQDNWMKYFC